MKTFGQSIALCLWPMLTSADEASNPNGVWQTDGYGWILEISADQVQVFNSAKDVCVPETNGFEPIGSALKGFELEFLPGGSELHISSEVEKHSIRAVRIPGLPDMCLKGDSNDPKVSLDAFLAYFQHQYPFHKIYQVDFEKQRNWSKQMLTSDASDKDLFAVMAHFMLPLNDGHIGLFAEIDDWPQRVPGYRGKTLERIVKYAQRRGKNPDQSVHAFRESIWTESIGKELLKGKGRSVGNNRIQFGKLSDNVGYLAFLTVGDFDASANSPKEELIATQVLLNEIFTFFIEQEFRTLILDLSLNFGGSDYIAREIASRFVQQPTPAYSKFAADASDPIITRYSVIPSEYSRFHGNVLLMTSDVTVSAAEVLTMMLRDLPQVTHLGERTRGSLSDILSRRLPNGWILHLSNEVYLDSSGNHWEAQGIEPHVYVDVFEENRPVESHQNAVLEALNLEDPCARNDETYRTD